MDTETCVSSCCCCGGEWVNHTGRGVDRGRHRARHSNDGGSGEITIKCAILVSRSSSSSRADQILSKQQHRQVHGNWQRVAPQLDEFFIIIINWRRERNCCWSGELQRRRIPGWGLKVDWASSVFRGRVGVAYRFGVWVATRPHRSIH